MEAFECKLSSRAKAKGAAGFAKAYPGCPIRTVSPGDLMNVWTAEELQPEQ
jgi:hypothetical protein